jgi:putative transposase
MIELGYEPPDLDELLLWVSRNPNPYSERLPERVQSSEFAFDRH